jgi:HK97 family phage prohead protease
MTIERRDIRSAPELRKDGDAKVAAGYAALFNTETDIGGYFRERIAPGAFKDAIKGDVRALIDHDTGRVIGRTAAGTLRLSEDATGLSVEIDLPDTTDGRDLAVQLDRGDITGMSFGFRVTHDEWDETGDTPLRTIHSVELFEVSAVAFPAYDDTSIGLRSLDAARAEKRRKNFNAAATRLRMKTTLDLASRSKAKA